MQWKQMLLVLLAGVLMISGLSTPIAQPQVAPTRIEITARQSTFEPAEITLKKGQPTVIVLKSVDVAHGLHIRELNVELKVGEGGTAEMQLTPDKTGDFVGHCIVFCGPGHGSMALKVHVVD